MSIIEYMVNLRKSKDQVVLEKAKKGFEELISRTFNRLNIKKTEEVEFPGTLVASGIYEPQKGLKRDIVLNLHYGEKTNGGHENDISIFSQGSIIYDSTKEGYLALKKIKQRIENKYKNIGYKSLN